MASGYEKSPDYGGREPTLWGMILPFLFIFALFAISLYWPRG
jgi:hypothetical protein